MFRPGPLNSCEVLASLKLHQALYPLSAVSTRERLGIGWEGMASSPVSVVHIECAGLKALQQASTSYIVGASEMRWARRHFY